MRSGGQRGSVRASKAWTWRCVMDTLIASLLVWIGMNSSLSVAQVPIPKVVEMSPREIARQVRDALAIAVDESRLEGRVLGFYDPDAGPVGTIYVLRADLAPNAARYADKAANPYFQERLLHELIHHVQFRTAVIDSLPCRAAAERDAYRLGGAFLDQRRVPDRLANRAYWIRHHGSCSRFGASG
ncbi:MAG: DUF6647 family protein [Burkholderiaceae bacterium]